jgi:hypothetical protein
MSVIIRVLSSVVFTATLLGCGEKEADTASTDSALAGESAAMVEEAETTSTASASTPSNQPSDASSRPATVEDIDRWQKGMAGEREALEAVAAKMKQAKTTTDKLTILEEAHELSTAAAGAQAAGLDEGRYNFIRAKLSGVVAYLAPLDIPGMDAAETPQMSAEREDYLKKTAWAVPPEVVEALKPRAADLRKQDMELVAARAKASGMQ